MRPAAPDFPDVQPDDPEITPAENPLSKFIQDAMRRGFRDFEVRLPELLKPLLDEAATRAATSVINAIAPRLYSLETDVRRLNEGERDSGKWRVSIEERFAEIEARVARTERALHPPTEPSPPPGE